MTSLLFGLLHPHTLAKLCSVFKVLTPATQVAFVIISEASCFCQELFFWYLVIYLSSLVISDSRQFNILPSLNLSVKNFFEFIFSLSHRLATSNYITWFISKLQELFYSFLKYFCHQCFALTRLYLRYRIIFFLASVFFGAKIFYSW